MVTPTDEHRAQVLALYRDRRVNRYETPHQAMSGIADVMAHAAMLSLIDGREVAPSLLAWWQAARTYTAAMQGRSPWWYESRLVKRSCISVPA